MTKIHQVQVYTLCVYLHWVQIVQRNVLHLTEIHLMISRAAEKAANKCTLKMKSHNINSLCDCHNQELFEHIQTSLSNFSCKMLCLLVLWVALTATVINHIGQCKRTGCCYNELVVAIFRTGAGVKGKTI